MSLDERFVDRFYSYAEDVYLTLKESKTDDVIFYFVGDLSKGYANAISSKLETILEARVSDKLAQKRFYTVYIEAIQNIRIHGLTTESGEVLGSVSVSLGVDRISARFLNVVPNALTPRLLAKYKEVNELDRTALKKRYMDQMMHGELSTKGGAGLGIITIVLRSKNPSKVEVIPLSDEYGVFKSEIVVNYQPASL